MCRGNEDETQRKKRLDYHKQYYQNHKDKILSQIKEKMDKAHYKEQINCPICSKKLSRGALSRHKKRFHS